MADDPQLRAHREWLGFLQPIGVVVSPPALVTAQVVVDRNVAEAQTRLQALCGDSDIPLTFVSLATAVLGWSEDDLAGHPAGPRLPDGLEVVLPEYHETLRPSLAALDFDPAAANDAPRAPLALILEIPSELDLDARWSPHETGWKASPHARLERMLRELNVSWGLLWNGRALRLLAAPRGESAGYMTFHLDHMVEVQGRPILGALTMLLGRHTVFEAPDGRRLSDLITESRKHQASVSNDLAGQVLEALAELLRGFQAADTAASGQLLGPAFSTDPDHIYGGMLTTLMRLVFLLYAEDQGLLPDDEVYQRHYSVVGLFERLRTEAGHHPDTMDQRFGAWSQLLTLFRLVFDGGGHGGMRLPPREGELFDPDAYPFLEGRPMGVHRVKGGRFEPPRVSDGTLHRVLERLLMLKGDRLSYRALDVEQIGSVYESMMGFVVEKASGPSIALGQQHVVVNLEDLLAQKSASRGTWLKAQAEVDVSGKALAALKIADSPEAAVEALSRRTSPLTPHILPAGSYYLQPGEARRQSGSHYTPRTLTEPIVSVTLKPVLQALGERPTPEKILGLKVCDPAMGSGAFLVEACRQLAEVLVRAWADHPELGGLESVPTDEDPLLHARRLVAQRCLYGVDKNPFAVSLAKLSLWLVTLAKDHPFTFLDHALKEGDSLIGLSRQQITDFHWEAKEDVEAQRPMLQYIFTNVGRAKELRDGLHALGEDAYAEKRLKYKDSEDALSGTKLTGDLVIAAFFQTQSGKDREKARAQLHAHIKAWRSGQGNLIHLQFLRDAALRKRHHPIRPFHWEIEFPEVFYRPNPGFDAFVGNPPFAGKNTIAAGHPEAFLPWMKELHPGSHGNSDLVAHFYRRAFSLLREGGSFGLIATNTIAQGDTRTTGLRWICTHGGTIYEATRRRKWPGKAAVVVSVVHVKKGAVEGPRVLDGRPVDEITAFLFHAGGHEDPKPLKANAGKSFIGSMVLGMGFTFDDSNPEATPIAEMYRLIQKDPRNAERIFPYIGGSEVNASPTHAHHRYVINFEDMDENEARQWPDLMAIVEEKVRPERIKNNRQSYRESWWKFAEKRVELMKTLESLESVLFQANVAKYIAFAILPASTIIAAPHNVVTLEGWASFSVLQSRIHEVWARFFGSSLEDRIRYTPTDCFETFPFPPSWDASTQLRSCGEDLYGYRSGLMTSKNEGLTTIYNRLHDPDDQDADIQKLRDLHSQMDLTVLGAFGWTDLKPSCEFLLDYEDQEASEEPGSHQRTKPWRYRWPDEVQEEVLARLLALNQERAAEEEHQEMLAQRREKDRARRAALKAVGEGGVVVKAKTGRKGKGKKGSGPAGQTRLGFGEEGE